MDGSGVFARRWVVLGSLVSVAAIGYIALFATSHGAEIPHEQRFESGASGGAAPIDMYLDMLAFDPVRESLDARLDYADATQSSKPDDFGVESTAGSHGPHYYGVAARNLSVHLSDASSARDIELRRNAMVPSTSFAADVAGAIGNYPFDRYTGVVRVDAFERSRRGTGRRIPMRLVVWQGLQAWNITVTQVPRSAARGVELSVVAYRPSALIFFSSAIYGVMALVALSALTIGTLLFIGLRSFETGWIGALTAMAFSLPLFRGVLPGAPPLGVLADVFVLLWAELAVALALALSLVVWMRRGSSP